MSPRPPSADPPAPPLLRVRGVGARAGGVVLLEGLDLDLAPGGRLGIVGESGAGKSLATAAIIGLPPPGVRIDGSVRLDGVELIGRPDRELRRIRGRRIGLVQQDPTAALDPTMTIGAQVGEAARLHLGLRGAALDAHVRRLLDQARLTGDARRPGAYPHELSGGQRQRVCIAAALSAGPDLLLADEPTTALDAPVQAEILALIDALCAELGMALVLISHDLGVVGRLTERVAALYAGRPVERGPTAATLAAPRHPYVAALLAARPDRPGGDGRLAAIPGAMPRPEARPAGCAFRPRCAYALPLCAAEPPWPEIETAPDAARCHLDPPAPSPRAAAVARPTLPEAAPTLTVVAARKAHALPRARLLGPRPRLLAVDGVSLMLRPGEILGLVGASGCGKSTLARLIVGLERPDRGEIRRAGPAQMVFQNPAGSLDPRWTIGRSVAEPLGALPRAARAARVAECLAAVGLDPAFADRRPHALSGGQRQRAAIARALAPRPSLIVADEPTSALDLSVQAQILNLLADLARAERLAVVLISHDLAVVGHVAHRVAVMAAGRIVEEGPAEQVLARPRSPEGQALAAARMDGA